MTALEDRIERTNVSAPPVASELITLPTGRGRARSSWRLPRGVERFVGVVVLFAFWEAAARAGWVSARQLPAPSTVLTAGWDLARNGVLGPALWASLQRWCGDLYSVSRSEPAWR